MKQSNLSSIVVAGAGYTGRRLLHALEGRSERIIAVSQSTRVEIPRLESVRIDLDRDLPDRIDAGENSLVCYLIPPAVEGNPESRFQRFADDVMVNSPRRFLLISTTGVYGDCQGEWVDETRPLNPESDRARRRVEVEEYCISWAKEQNVSLAIFRVAGIYGPGRVPVERLRKGFALPEDSPGGFSNRIHVDDLVRACTAGLLGSGIGVFNVSDGHPTRYREYFTLVAQIWGLPEAADGDDSGDSISPVMRSYLRESRKIDNRKLLETFSIDLKFPHPAQGLLNCRQSQ